MKIRNIILSSLLAGSVAYAEPLEITIPIYSIYPSGMSLQSMNVDTVHPQGDANTVIIGDLLSNNSSFSVVRSGGKGQTTSVFTRGTNSNHTLFMINGSAITDHSTTNHLFDAGVDSVNYATSIDLYKGSNSAYFGHNAIGGAVNINTDVSLSDELTISTGSNNTKLLSLQKGFSNDAGLYSIKLGLDQSDGYSVVKNGDDDGYQYNYVNFDSEHWVNGGVVKTTVINRNTEVDLDGSGVDDTDYTSDQNFQLYQIIYQGNEVQWVLDHNAYDRQYVNGSEFDDYNSSTNHARLSTNKTINEIDFVLGSEVSMYSADFTNRGSYNSSVDKSAETYATFLNFDWIGERLIWNGGVRNDWHSLHDSAMTYRLGINYKLVDQLSMIAGTSTGFRSPSLYELYGADNFGYTGNPNLKEETSVTYEIGLKADVEDSYSKFKSKSTFFITEITDQITYANSTYNNDSDGKTVINGWDFSSQYSIDDTKINLGLMYVSAQDSDNNQLLRRPWWQGNIGVEQMVTDKLQLWTGYKYYGKHKDTHSTNYTTITQDAQHNIDAGFKYLFKDDMLLTGSVTNLLNADNQRPHGYSQPGTEFSLSFKYFF
jgi:vitamin B12 transporter